MIEFSGFVVYEGKVFEAGDYPDKEFSISPDELQEKALSFTGVDLDLEHSQFRDLLGHRLGRLEKVMAGWAGCFWAAIDSLLVA